MRTPIAGNAIRIMLHHLPAPRQFTQNKSAVLKLVDYGPRLVIDEIQYAPALLERIKVRVGERKGIEFEPVGGPLPSVASVQSVVKHSGSRT